jgi:hypothetical protein
MRRIKDKVAVVIVLSSVAIVLTTCRSSVGPIDPFEVEWEDRTPFREGLIGAQRSVLDELPGASVYHIDIEISEDLSLLQGTEAILYTNQEDVVLEDIYLRLYPNVTGGAVTLTDLTVDGEEAYYEYEYDDTAARILLPQVLGSGDQATIQMQFEIEVPSRLTGNYGIFGRVGGVLVLGLFYPVIPVYDDEGWNVESPPRNADLSYFDISFYLVRVSVPEGLQVVASGVEVGREPIDRRDLISYAAGPMRDFFLAGSYNYVKFSEKEGGTTVNSYAFPEQAEGAQLALQATVNSLRSFNERYSTYPYTELDVVATPMQALGNEYPGVGTISDSLYRAEDEVSSNQGWLEGTVAHEMAHQWFYNAVGNDQVDEPWLDEALAQYLTAMYFRDTYGSGAEGGYRQSWEYRWERVDRDDIPIGMPAAEYSGSEYGAIVYGRGPLFVEALALTMGEETFAKFLRDYYESHKWGIGTSESFRELAEHHCQCDLTALFETWVY